MTTLRWLAETPAVVLGVATAICLAWCWALDERGGKS
jgi:hypothetical protein